MKEETTNIIIEISSELHTSLKMEAVKRKISLKELVTPALEKIIK